MPSKNRIARRTDTKFEIEKGLSIPLRIYEEYRSGIRATIGKSYLIFRIPVGPGRQQMLDQLGQWARKTYLVKPEAFARLLPHSLPEVGHIHVMGESYTIYIQRNTSNNSHQAQSYADDPYRVDIQLTGSDRRPELQQVDALLSRIFVQKYESVVLRELLRLNEQHFKVRIEGLQLKNTTSLWGSCTTKGKINISSRLLLAPAFSRQAVLVHELAHRLEMNHSPAFWKLVYEAMPDYDQAHMWLEKMGRQLKFVPAEVP